MPRLLPFAFASRRRAKTVTDLQPTILSLMNDLQVLALERPLAMQTVVLLVHRLARRKRERDADCAGSLSG